VTRALLVLAPSMPVCSITYSAPKYFFTDVRCYLTSSVVISLSHKNILSTNRSTFGFDLASKDNIYVVYNVHFYHV
jgi:hypothetical protein